MVLWNYAVGLAIWHDVNSWDTFNSTMMSLRMRGYVSKRHELSQGDFTKSRRAPTDTTFD